MLQFLAIPTICEHVVTRQFLDLDHVLAPPGSPSSTQSAAEGKTGGMAPAGDKAEVNETPGAASVR